MKLRVNIIITFITAAILASCSSATINYPNELSKSNKTFKETDINKYFRYQDFSGSSLEDLDTLNSRLQTNRTKEIKNLRSNINKILSKKQFTLTLKSSEIYSFKLMELIYSFGLPISIQWDQSDKKDIFQSSVTEKISGFCSSIYGDAQKSISKKINNLQLSTLLLYSTRYENIQKLLSKQFPEMQTIQFSEGDEQKFASIVLGINKSKERFKKIANLNPNQELKFDPRPRGDIKNIVLLLEPDQYQSVLPAFRYHGGDKFQYINFISSLENLDTVNQLLDFENSLIPFPFYLSEKIQSKEILSMEKIMQLSMLNDWLILEIIKQAGIQNAKISGMTGNLSYQRGSCTKRVIPMQRIGSTWLTS